MSSANSARGQRRLLPSALRPASLLGDALPEAAAPGNDGGPGYVLGSPGRPSVVPTLCIAVFDDSGSVVSPAGTDPLSGRFAEVDRAFSLVARRGSRRELGAVLHFDVPSSAEVAPLPLRRDHLGQLRAGLRVPAEGAGSSRLQPSLHRAFDLAAAYPDHAVRLLVLSDFLLLDRDPAAVLAELAAFSGTVHAVLLGDRADADRPPAPVRVTTVRRDSPPGAVSAAVFDDLTRTRPGSQAFRAAASAGDAGPGDPSSSISQRRWRRKQAAPRGRP